MTFNNLPAFGTISKSTPTTSTTNENTICTPPSSGSNPPQTGTESPQLASPSSTLPRSPFMKGMFMRGTPVVGESSSSASVSNGQTVSASVESMASNDLVDGTTSRLDSNLGKSSSRSELIGLFDKFDLGKNEGDTDKNRLIELDIGDEVAEVKETSASQGATENVVEKEEEHLETEHENRDKEKCDNDTIDSELTEPEQSETTEKHVTPLISVQPYIPIEQPSNAFTKEVSEDSYDQSNQNEHKVPVLKGKLSSNLIDISDDEDDTSNQLRDETQSPIPEDVTSPKTPGREILDITEDDESGVEEFQLKHDENNYREIDSNGEPSHSTKLDKAKSHVSPSEQYQQSHRPFDFHNFLSQLRKKSADPVVRYIRSFLGSYSRQGHTFSANQRIKIIVDFKRFMNEKFAIYEPFASMDNIDLENSREGLEKLIMNRLYVLCFPPEVIKLTSTYIPESYRNDLIEDEEFSLQLEKFNWINGSHLDIDMDSFVLAKSVKDDQNFLDYATSELNKINNYRAPRDKIICILNCCKIIFSYLKVTNKETNADSFVPLLILVIFKAKTTNLISNIHYIESFRGEEWLLHGETSYYLSSIQGAIGFIQNLSIGDLTISQSEYDAHMEAWEAQRKIIEESRLLQLEAKPILTNTSSTLMQPASSSDFQSGLSPSSVLLSSAEIFTKSISNFWSSPLPQPQPGLAQIQESRQNEDGGDQAVAQLIEVPNINEEYQPPPPTESEIDHELLKATYKSLKEIFPTLDKNILKDVIYINRGNVDSSIDACLQLVEDN